MAYFSQVFSSTVPEAQNGVAVAALKAIAQGKFSHLLSVVQLVKAENRCFSDSPVKQFSRFNS